MRAARSRPAARHVLRSSRHVPAPRSRHRLPRPPAWRARACRARRSSVRRVEPTAGRRASSPSQPRMPAHRPRRSPHHSGAGLRRRGSPRRAGGLRVVQAADAYASRLRASSAGTGSMNRAAEAIMAALSVQSASGARARAGKRPAELAVGRNAPDDGDLLDSHGFDRSPEALGEGTHDRPLVGRREVGPTRGDSAFAQVSDGVEERRLDAGEGEVEARDPRHREGERIGVTVARQARRSAAPPGYGRPSSRAPLSKASPAASSRVVPRRSNVPRSRTASKSV